MEQEKGGNKGRIGENEERDSGRKKKNGCQYARALRREEANQPLIQVTL